MEQKIERGERAGTPGGTGGEGRGVERRMREGRRVDGTGGDKKRDGNGRAGCQGNP